MTKINKITMEGFKSFQRKTAVPFYEGLTAIVGTNGSGKSNIQEAIQFVMGRRSSHLRAEKMEQLIFNGGEDRKPAESAEVTLYLDNSDGRFDELLDEEDTGVDEVKVGRKIKRNGYSTYRFMGTNCKRSKIDEVMDVANLHQDGYHIVRQGKVTDIVQQTPVERRKSIDRISGIAAYDDKKEDALEELEQVAEELGELQVKLDMKKDQLERLERDKEDAETYQKLQEKKERLEVSVLQLRKDELDNQLDNLSDEGQEEIEELEEHVEELDAGIEELEDQLEEIEDEITAQQDDGIQQQINNIANKIERKKDQIQNNKDKIKDIEEVLKDYKRIQGSRAGASKTVQAVMQLGKPGVYGTVSELIHYNDRFAVALETAAGKRMQNIVVDNQQTATECVNHLKQNSIGRATFLPMDKVRPRNSSKEANQAIRQPGVIDYAINLVDYDDEHATAVKYVFGDTLVAEDLESLKDAGRVRAVTLDGDIMRKGGSITGGAKKKKKKSRSSKPKFNPEEKKTEKQGLEQEIDDMKQEIGELNQLLEEKKEEAEEQSEVSEELKQERSDVRDELRELKQERKEKAEELNTLRSKVGKDQKKRAQFEAELNNIEDDLNELPEFDEDELEDGSLKSLKTKKTKTINKMNNLGNVNMRAIDEYAEFKEEYDGFKEKVDQIRQEKREIEQIIEDIEEQKTRQFMDALNQINDDFNDLFQTLFEGGEATLELEEEENIDSGLVIKAQPPNKDPHMIDSLSGGEKTLTAIAFVFALQEYKPSPFYVMDEIDAALDDKNAKRLANLLNDYADEGQCIVISHRNETVRHADRAYGVSMTEGISKVRSVDLDAGEMPANN